MRALLLDKHTNKGNSVFKRHQPEICSNLRSGSHETELQVDSSGLEVHPRTDNASVISRYFDISVSRLFGDIINIRPIVTICLMPSVLNAQGRRN